MGEGRESPHFNDGTFDPPFHSPPDSASGKGQGEDVTWMSCVSPEKLSFQTSSLIVEYYFAIFILWYYDSFSNKRNKDTITS